MKKIYLLISAVVLSTSVEAQQMKQHSGATLLKTISLDANSSAAKTTAAGDTVGWQNFTDFLPEFAPSGQLSIFGYTGGGYVYGKNNDSLNVCGQGYLNVAGTPVSIDRAIVWAAAKSHTGTAPTSNLTVRLWDMAPNKAYSYNGTTFVQDKDGPNTVKIAKTVPFASIDTSSTLPTSPWTIVTFSAAVTFTGNFAIELNSVTLAAGDTVGFVSDKKNDANGQQMTFHKQWYGGTSYGPWVVTDGGYFTAGALDNNIAAFPIVTAATAVKEFFNGVKLSALYPNPTKDVATISYSLEKESNNVSLEVYNIKGQKVFGDSFGTQQAGDYKINLDASSYASGSYFYQLRSNGNVITKEFIVTK